MVHLLEASVLKTNEAITFSVVFYYIANEGLSIIENALTFTPVPVKVKKVFEQLRDKNDDEGEDEE